MISILNYGMGNIRSVKNALGYLGVKSQVIDKPEQLLESKKLILPGVGSFRKAMENIKEKNFLEPLNEIVLDKKIFDIESKKIATQLLKKALRSRPDPETAKSIRDRLKILGPKPVLKSKCQNCGKMFESNKKKYKRYTICYECYKKRYSNT